MLKRIYLIITIFSFIYTPVIFAANRTINLHVTYKTVNFTGKSAKAIVVNGQIPGPTLHFKKGDNVTINVYNHLDRGTAIHWHGILLPWRMDGVAHVTQEPIPPGGVFHYKYKLKQSGTYWYHAHADLQEQQGLYGAYIIDPLKPPPYHYNKDFVMVLSDWTNSDPDQVYDNLKRDGDYYSSKFPLQPSLTHFLRSYKKATPARKKLLLKAYSMMQTTRMSPYDFSDVAYDAYLLNGHTRSHPWKAKVKVGDVVRLRFIGAGASTQFLIKVPGTKMQVVHVQGNNVKPYETDSLRIAPGETYDVLVKIKKNKPYIIYSEANDKSGKIYGALVTSMRQPINFASIKPFPEPPPVMMMMGSGNHLAKANKVDTSKTKYNNLRSTTWTNNPDKPFEVINMVLSGWMGKYVWFLNGLPEYKAKPILIQPGKRYRIIFKNNSIMHHPMHIHGHWFFLRNNHGAHDPKLHTIDVPPNATMIVDFDADANSGFWYFHCHNLFHMKAGMANIVRYKETPIPSFLKSHAVKLTNNGQLKEHVLASAKPGHHADEEYNMRQLIAHPSKWYRASYLDISANPFDELYQVTYRQLFGSDYNKLQLYTEDAEVSRGKIEDADMDVFYWRSISQFWALKGGVNYYYRPSKKPYFQPGIGFEGLTPYFIDTNVRAYYRAGSTKLDIQLSRDTQIGDNFFIRAGIRSILASKTIAKDEIGSGLNQMRFILRPYVRLSPGLNLFTEFEHQQYYGVTRHLVIVDGSSAISNTLTLGLSFIL